MRLLKRVNEQVTEVNKLKEKYRKELYDIEKRFRNDILSLSSTRDRDNREDLVEALEDFELVCDSLKRMCSQIEDRLLNRFGR